MGSDDADVDDADDVDADVDGDDKKIIART